MMFRRLQKQLHDTELGTGSGTTGTRTCTYVQVQWGYTGSITNDDGDSDSDADQPVFLKTVEKHVKKRKRVVDSSDEVREVDLTLTLTLT
jgi:hypothetical protein